jgi:hypothetical protein
MFVFRTCCPGACSFGGSEKSQTQPEFRTLKISIYKNEYRIFKPVEITIRRGLR